MNFLIAHESVILALLAAGHFGLAGIAVASSMPNPDAPFSWYRWFYDAVHNYLGLLQQNKLTSTSVQLADGGSMRKIETSNPTQPKENIL